MLISILAIIYISFICWTWGSSTLYIFNYTKPYNILHSFGITCFIGLIVITILGLWTSLFLPLGKYYLHFFLLAPIFIIFYNKHVKSQLDETLKELIKFDFRHTIILLLIFLLLLIIHSWTIIHPDTLGYHSQIIQWIGSYKIIPGLSHLNERLSLQSSWFIASSLFSFQFLGSGTIFLNITVCFWFVIFLIDRSHTCSNEGKSTESILWIGLLAITLWSYTQIRLTVSSFSPDFIACIAILLLFYLLLNNFKNQKETNNIFSAILIAFTFTLKISAIPLAILEIILLKNIFKKNNLITGTIVSTICIFIVLPFLIRNFVTSGYPLYPTNILSFRLPNWALPLDKIRNTEEYITAYARTESLSDLISIKHSLQLPVKEWIPIWWGHRSTSDKFILVLTSLSLLIQSIYIVYKKNVADKRKLFIITILLFCIVFWAWKAPDPRFGWGYILTILCYNIHTIFCRLNITVSKKIIDFTFFSLLLILSISIVYRISKYSNFKMLFVPLGVEKGAYTRTSCKGQIYFIPKNLEASGNTSLPCTIVPCDEFEKRGNSLENGFKLKNHP